MTYATNTSFDVIRVGDLYYTCFQGAWFVSTTPKGRGSRPRACRRRFTPSRRATPSTTIPTSTSYPSSADDVVFGFTAGYLMGFVTVGVLRMGPVGITRRMSPWGRFPSTTPIPTPTWVTCPTTPARAVRRAGRRRPVGRCRGQPGRRTIRPRGLRPRGRRLRAEPWRGCLVGLQPGDRHLRPRPGGRWAERRQRDGQL